MRILVLGAPGVGKGSQATRIARALSIPHIATGDLFREQIAGQTDIGRKVSSYINQGSLVPDEITIEILVNRFSRDDCRAGFVLDGFPRTLIQAQHLDEMLVQMNIRLDVVVNISLDDVSILKRITGRRICSKCGMIYHIDHHPPVTAGTCDECSGDLYQRPDDSVSVLEQRLHIYHDLTSPLIDYYRRMDQVKYVEIESEDLLAATTKSVFKALNIKTKVEVKSTEIDPVDFE